MTDELLDQWRERTQFEKDWAQKINVRLEADGTVSLSGIPYRDFSSLITAASLHRYESDTQPPSSQESYDEALRAHKRGVPELWSGKLEVLRSNLISDLKWRISMRALIDAIDKGADVALRKHNAEYSKWELRYFKWISGPRWKLIRLGLAIKRFWKKNGYSSD